MGDSEPSASPPSSHTSRDRRLVLLVFLTLVGVHTFCLGKELGYTEDALPILQHVEMVVRHGAWTTPVNPDGDYSMYGIGMTLWYLPVRILGGLIVPEGVDPKVEAFYLRLGYVYLNVLATAGTGAIVCAWSLQLGFSRKASALAAMCASLATLAFPYARYDFSEPVAGFFLFAGVFFLWRHRRTQSRADLFCAGVLLGCGALTRIVIGLAVVPLLGFVWASLESKRSVQAWASLLGPLGIAALGIGLYNAGRFGDPFETGYPIDFETPLLEGLVGLAVSWGRGAIFYTPVSVVGFAVLFTRFSSERWLKAVTAFLVCFFLVLHAKWSYWYGGWCWGPRLLLPILPFAGLGLAKVFEGERLRRIWVTLLFGAGGLINFLAVFVPFSVYFQTALVNGFQEEWLLWRRFYCPLFMHHELLTQIRAEDYDFIWLGARDWGPAAAAIGLLGALLAGAGLRGVWVHGWRRTDSDESPDAQPVVESGD